MGLKQGLINTLFLTFAHNQYAIAFFIGIIIALGLLIYKPSRYAALLLTGFLTLLVGFEYNKHIMEGLQNQTLESLSIGIEHQSIKLYVIRTFQKLLPVVFFIIGWGSIFIAIISKGVSNRSLRE